jgi:hypothetical protein
VPCDIDFRWKFLESEWTYFVEVGLDGFVREVIRICPIEQVNVEIKRLRWCHPKPVIGFSGL